MAVRYLNRLRSQTDDPYIILFQLCNVPELYWYNKCIFCWYRSLLNENYSFTQCSNAHSCGGESLLWLEVIPDIWAVGDGNPIATPTRITRYIKRDGVYRYAQLMSLDIPGYECNKQCAYYPSRVTSSRSVASCSQANGCGRNGSAWALLHVNDRSVWTLPNFNQPPSSLDAWITTRNNKVNLGQEPPVISNAAYIVVRDVLGTWWRIVNMIPFSKNAGRLLVGKDTDTPDQWTWDTRWADMNFFEFVPLYDITDPLCTLLMQRGMTRNQILG